MAGWQGGEGRDEEERYFGMIREGGEGFGVGRCFREVEVHF